MNFFHFVFFISFEYYKTDMRLNPVIAFSPSCLNSGPMFFLYRKGLLRVHNSYETVIYMIMPVCFENIAINEYELEGACF